MEECGVVSSIRAELQGTDALCDKLVKNARDRSVPIPETQLAVTKG